MQSRTHLRCNRNSAKLLSVLSPKPRECFLPLQNLKTNSLRRIVFKEPGNFGLPTQWCEKVAISLQNIPVPYSILEAASFEERGTYVFICKLMDYLLRSCQSYDKFF